MISTDGRWHIIFPQKANCEELTRVHQVRNAQTLADQLVCQADKGSEERACDK